MQFGRMLGSILLVLLVAYLGACAVLYFAQRSLIYFPQPRHNTQVRTLTLAADGAQVLVSLRPAEGSEAVVYFGGNAEDVSLSLPQVVSAFPHHALYLMHYRGYGGSSGTASESALFAPYNSMQELVAQRYPYFPVRWLLRDQFSSWKYAKKIAAPTAIIMAQHDEVIPEASTRALLAHFRPDFASLAVVRGAGHNTIAANPDYVRLLNAQR